MIPAVREEPSANHTDNPESPVGFLFFFCRRRRRGRPLHTRECMSVCNSVCECAGGCGSTERGCAFTALSRIEELDFDHEASDVTARSVS